MQPAIKYVGVKKRPSVVRLLDANEHGIGPNPNAGEDRKKTRRDALFVQRQFRRQCMLQTQSCVGMNGF